MKPYRSGRSWLPALVASLGFALTLIVLQLIFHYGYDDRPTPDGTSVLPWLFRTHLGFWGPGAFDPDETEMVISNIAGGLVLILVVFLITWLALRGTAPGSAAIPAFLSMWAATMFAAPAAAVVIIVIRLADEDAPMGPFIATAAANSDFGLKWGWIAALIASFAWVIARPSPAPAAPAYTPPPMPTPMPTTPPGAHVSDPSDQPPPTTSYQDPSA